MRRIKDVRSTSAPCLPTQGSIPAALSTLVNAAAIDLSGNSLTGPIPSSLVALSPAATLSINNNAGVCGGIPRTVQDNLLVQMQGSSTNFPCFEDVVDVNLGSAASTPIADRMMVRLHCLQSVVIICSQYSLFPSCPHAPNDLNACRADDLHLAAQPGAAEHVQRECLNRAPLAVNQPFPYSAFAAGKVRPDRRHGSFLLSKLYKHNHQAQLTFISLAWSPQVTYTLNTPTATNQFDLFTVEVSSDNTIVAPKITFEVVQTKGAISNLPPVTKQQFCGVSSHI